MMDVPAARAVLHALLCELVPGKRVAVRYWSEHYAMGSVRIEAIEVGEPYTLDWRAYDQFDPTSAPVLFACERFILGVLQHEGMKKLWERWLRANFGALPKDLR